MTNPMPTPLDFLVKHPLYENLVFGSNDAMNDYLFKIEDEIEHYDWHCKECDRNTVFLIDVDSVETYSMSPYKYFHLTAKCTRSKKHAHMFLILIEKKGGLVTLTKIGQFPSLADLSQAENNKYRKVLEENKFKELSRGIGLAAHGIGIGAFVYLRRVFESQIEDAHLVAREVSQWDEEKYQKSRMDEKIKLLKDYLPDFLVKNSSIYGILSKGIHELEEDECRTIFPAIKTAIEMILDEKIRAKELAEKEINAAKAISKVQSQLKKS